MKFYSGFSLKNEKSFFDDLIHDSEYTICGFSYGAIAALNKVIDLLQNNRRVDTLQLFSPAFFQDRDKTFKRLQLISYKKDTNAYIKQFIKSCFLPYQLKETQHIRTTVDELQELLEYEWSLDSLEIIQRAGVKIEVYLGAKDEIINALEAKEFFLQNATVTYIKDANHFLQIDYGQTLKKEI